MSFGKKILEKYGYKEGEGLGRNSNGIVQPIKATFKFDNSGLGDKSAGKEDHWWERVFNEATTNINVNKSSEGEIKVDLNDKEGVEITNKSYSMKKLMKSNNKLQYGNFLKSATLGKEGEEKEIEGHVSTTDIEIKPTAALSDEDLLKACGFRTAHKGARHGLKLSGKLQRIADQEKALLEKLKTQNRTEIFKAPQTEEPEKSPKKSRKRPLMELNSSKDESSDESELPINLEYTTKLKKSSKKTKKERKQLNILADIIESIDLDKKMSQESLELEKSKKEASQHVDTPVRKKKKDKSKHKEIDELDKIVEEIEQVSEKKSDKIRKRKLKKQTLSDDEEMSEIEKPSRAPKETHNKPKRVKLDDSVEASDEASSDKDIDEINEQHHMNLSSIKKAEELKSANLESSLKKKKKRSKGKSKQKAFQAQDDWSIKHQKGAKSEHKKLKMKQKHQKELEERTKKSKKSKKLAKKEKRKELDEIASKVVSEINVGL